MKLITLECPNCNASLQVNEELSEAQCNYCGKHFVIDSEMLRNARKEGYDFERGRMDAQEMSSAELAERIKAVKEPMDQVYDLNKKREKIKRKKAALDVDYESNLKYFSFFQSSVGKNSAFILMDIILAIVLVVKFMAGVTAFAMFIWLIIDIAAAFGVMVFSVITLGKNEDYIETIENLNAEDKEIRQAIGDIEASTDVGFIPEKYRYQEAIDFFYDVAKRKRASTLQQAINLYEDKLNQDEIERMRQQQFDEMKEYYERQLQEQKKQTEVLTKISKKPEKRIIERNTVYIEKEDDSNSALQAISTAGGLIVAGSMIAKAIKKTFKD